MSGPRQVVSPYVGPIWVWSDSAGNCIEAGAWWDQQIQPWIDGVVDPVAWAIDLGASIGWFTIYMAGLFKHVLSVEAHPQTFTLLQRNLAERGLQNVTAINVAAYDRETTLSLMPASIVGFTVTEDLGDCLGASSVAFGPAAWFEATGQLALLRDLTLEVPARPIDAFVPPDAHVALIKCDVQGCDLRALVGLEQTIRRCRPRILWEVEHGIIGLHGDTQETYKDFFDRMGYSVTRVRDDLFDYVSDPIERGGA